MVAVPAWLSIAQNLVKLEKFSAQIDTTSNAQTSATGIAPLYDADKYHHVIVSRRTGLFISSDTSSAPAYSNDLPDEMGTIRASENGDGPTSLWIREE